MHQAEKNHSAATRYMKMRCTNKKSMQRQGLTGYPSLLTPFGVLVLPCAFCARWNAFPLCPFHNVKSTRRQSLNPWNVFAWPQVRLTAQSDAPTSPAKVTAVVACLCQHGAALRTNLRGVLSSWLDLWLFLPCQASSCNFNRQSYHAVQLFCFSPFAHVYITLYATSEHYS